MSEHEVRLPKPFTPTGAADLAEIQQKIYFYGWCMDHRRFDDLDALFMPDAIVHYDVPNGTKLPWPEMKQWLPKGLEIFRRHPAQHVQPDDRARKRLRPLPDLRTSDPRPGTNERRDHA